MKRTLCVAFALCLATPAVAQAHLMNTGLGPFYDGLTHLFVSPEDLLPVIALALFSGLRGPQSGRAVLFVLPVAWLLGSLAGWWMAGPAIPATVSAAVTIALGALVAADSALPVACVVGLAIALGVLHGGLYGVEFAEQRTIGFSPAGTAVSLFVVVSLLAGQASAIGAATPRIVVRVAGSWIAAMGMFMLGWSMRG